MKHAGPDASAVVRLQLTPAEVRVEVDDDGTVGAGEPGTLGGGLTGMAERISGLGGELDCGPRHPQGWRVTARLSEGTVKIYVGRILAKLHLRDRGQAVVLAYESALITPGTPPDGPGRAH
jgi:signal transduction histidine kinase